LMHCLRKRQSIKNFVFDALPSKKAIDQKLCF